DPDRFRLDGAGDAAAVMTAPLGAAAGFLIPIFIVFIVAGLAASFAQNMPSVSLERIQPNFGKLSPMGGFKRLFGRTGLVEFGKGCFKLLAIGLVLGLLLNAERGAVTDIMFMPPGTIPDRMLAVVGRLLSGAAIAFLLLTAVDYVYARLSWQKRMRMSRQDIKDEMRQSEGDPHMKAKRRSVALDRARRRMIANVPRATVVIANPTHFSIALRYLRAEGGAPVVVAKGKDLLALKIREIAEANSILVVENKPLARSMYDLVEVDQAIPPQFYKAVAEIIHYVQTRNAPRSAGKPNTVVP
ncbi:MAG: flagellar type III secretion system protein FlhB, partial [Parafilimonas terrae]|nr:flagellar type III secretion system protein FlhB [Parafilimonas terrae]